MDKDCIRQYLASEDLTQPGYSSQNMMTIQQQDAASSIVQFYNTTTFILPTTTNFISVSALYTMQCSAMLVPYVDSFQLLAQDKMSTDTNNVKLDARSSSTTNSWTLTATLLRFCDNPPPTQYGFNCNEECSSIDDQYFCYTCNFDGQKVCCNLPDIDQSDCSYYNHEGPIPTTSTQNPVCNKSCSKENVYFWCMIGVSILAVALLLLLIIAVGWVVIHKDEKRKVQDINQDSSRRSSRKTQRAESPSRLPHPYYLNDPSIRNNRRTQEDEDSLADRWVEPMPRRTVQV